MKKSARILGQDYGLTAQEMNFVLQEEGYLDGVPGDYTVTEKGEKYATEEDHHRGSGGSSWYNRSWSTRTWDDSIQDDLDITPERKKELREAISTAKQSLCSSEDEDTVIASDCVSEEENSENTPDALVIAVGALLVGLSVYGIYKAAPYVRQWWHDKAVPGLKNLKSKVIQKTADTEEDYPDK